LNVQPNAVANGDAAKNSPANPETKQTGTTSRVEWLTKYSAQVALRDEQLKKDPEIQKKYLAAQRVELGMTYGPFFRMANLTPDQVAKLTDALARHAEFMTDLSAVMNAQTITNRQDATVWNDMRHDSQKELDVAVQSILGDDGFAEFQLYEREKPAWGQVGAFAAGLDIADMPMSFEQSEQLVKIIANASAPYQDGKTVDYGKIDWDAVDAGAQKILTPEQFELFSTTQFGMDGIMGGSRWSAQFNKALGEAMKPEAAK